MNHRTTFFTALALATGSLMASVTGCELIASVDRSKIAGTGGSGTGGSGGATSSSSSSSTGGTGGTTSSSSTGGTGGTGGSMMCPGGATSCTQDADCTAPTNECEAAKCDTGCCTTIKVENGTATATQTAGDCQKTICDGNGNTKSEDDDNDKPAGDECNDGICSGGSPDTSPKPSNTTCTTGGKVCDGAGTCVGCLSNANCTSPQVCSATHACVDPACTDSVKNGDETDTDCGGGDLGSGCAPCDDDKSCLVDSDCVNGYCDATNHCATPTCSDTVQNGNETDTDCGGAQCNGLGKTCAVNKHCDLNDDCTSQYCDTKVTPAICKTPTCSDTVQNGNETDTDCGGGSFQGGTACGKCPVNKKCNNANDCSTGFCNNGTCATKADGEFCAADTDCTNGHCVDNVCCNTACNGTCQACSAATKTTGGDGVCGDAKVNTDPHNSCTAQSPLICGLTGQCNGTGACQFVASGTSAPSGQTLGDCQKIVCNGSGGTSTADDPTDLPSPSTTVCLTSPVCSGSPATPSFTPASAGTDCTADGVAGKTVCGDGTAAGTCVQCNVDADCLATNDAGTLQCNAHTCQ
ncbi:Hypothetical protein A7982_11215 [Minicystis rosea]|nr:Hypothetical protein A7982_11215 [Minicystis rosea]